MSPNRRTSTTTRKWTNFEKHTLLCLMAKGLHIEDRSKRSDAPGAAKKNAYLEFATALNNSVYKNDFEKDISKREVTRMIDRMLVERKGVVGQGGYMERATRGRITRGLKRLWDRPTKFDYDGSLSEWNLWRKADEMEKRSIVDGRALNQDTASMQGLEWGHEAEDDVTTRSMVDPWKQADIAAASSRVKWPGSNQAAPSAAPNVFQSFKDWNAANSGTAARPATRTGHDSFHKLPRNLRDSSKYAWANPNSQPSSRQIASHSGTSDNSNNPPTGLPSGSRYRSSQNAASYPHSSSQGHISDQTAMNLGLDLASTSSSSQLPDTASSISGSNSMGLFVSSKPQGSSLIENATSSSQSSAQSSPMDIDEPTEDPIPHDTLERLSQQEDKDHEEMAVMKAPKNVEDDIMTDV